MSRSLLRDVMTLVKNLQCHLVPHVVTLVKRCRHQSWSDLAIPSTRQLLDPPQTVPRWWPKPKVLGPRIIEYIWIRFSPYRIISISYCIVFGPYSYSVQHLETISYLYQSEYIQIYFAVSYFLPALTLTISLADFWAQLYCLWLIPEPSYTAFSPTFWIICENRILDHRLEVAT